MVNLRSVFLRFWWETFCVNTDQFSCQNYRYCRKIINRESVKINFIVIESILPILAVTYTKSVNVNQPWMLIA